MIFKRALLTGAAGKLGSVLRKELSSKFDLLRSADIVPMDGVFPNEEVVVADLADPNVASELVAGVDAIIHFGAIVKQDASFEDINRVNMVGTHSLYDAALKHGVKRIVYASSIHAVGFYEQTEVIDARAPTRPDNYYGLSKVFGEAVAQLYWDRHRLETVSIRIGSSEETASNHRHLKTWLSYPDLVGLVERALSAPRV
ncbi:MAG TPA: NAD(P)-dependent oxidoreductase, partial [Devosia sp.]|nr:NAD(P)-dependent oxidoreductase [Devosia sp.]